MSKAKNYSELTDKVLQLYEDVVDKKISIDKANTLVKASNAVVNIQRAKILSTRVTGENPMKFFKD